MSRRVSSRDDLFLSALDMYTLLSLAFIGVAFMASYGADERGVLDLPTIPRRAQVSRPPDRGSDQVWVRWSETGQRVAATAQCQITLVKAGALPLATGARLALPCWPRAFSGEGSQSAQLLEAVRAWESEHLGQEPEAVILCDRKDLEACGRLQWVLAEHGLRPAAAVTTAQP